MSSEENDLDYGSSGEDDLDYSSDGDGAAEMAEEDKKPDNPAVEKHYQILKEEDIRQLQENIISEVSSFLSVSRGLACTLLYQYNWCQNSVTDKWFSGDEKISQINQPVNILGKRKSLNQVCKICFDEIGSENIVYVTCGHPFCADCWKKYIATSINDGPGCLTLACPEPGCKASLGLEMVDRLATGDERDKYYKYLYRSYVERSRNRKWCPAPGCELAIELDGGGFESYDVTCDCCHKFCWSCMEESHRPVDCETAAKWIEKNSSEAENTNWILAYTKPCPECKKPIEKNNGCSHMRCASPCGFQFCWVCLKGLTNHHTCNRYERDESEKDVNRRKNAKESLERYTHYYERWDSNDKSRKRALADLNQAKNKYIKKLASIQGKMVDDLWFVSEAWEQIVECRRVLKWTYAYGYYLSLENSTKMNFYECLQGEAEAALERLHHCAETEMDKYLRSHREDFRDFKSKLVDLTRATRNYFEGLVRSMENKLCEAKT